MGTEATNKVAFHSHLLGCPLALTCYLHWHLSCCFCGRGHSPNQLSSSPDFICNINNSICPRKLGWRYSELFDTSALQRGTSEISCAFHHLSMTPVITTYFTGEHNYTIERCCFWICPSNEPWNQLPTRGRRLGKTAFLETCNVNRLDISHTPLKCLSSFNLPNTTISRYIYRKHISKRNSENLEGLAFPSSHRDAKCHTEGLMRPAKTGEMIDICK